MQKLDTLGQLKPWRSLSNEEQLQLQVEFGHYLDSLPPTCSLETKIECFHNWLVERGIDYPG